jgi:BlaI family transcriptional regulator, penicillinase repressor
MRPVARPTRQRPTDAELEILTVLWERGPSTVREVHEMLGAAREAGYTTILKLMQIMARKGLVERDEDQRAHIYRATEARDQIQRRLVDDLVDRAFDGSSADLVLHALGARRASPADLAEIRRLLDTYEEKKR